MSMNRRGFFGTIAAAVTTALFPVVCPASEPTGNYWLDMIIDEKINSGLDGFSVLVHTPDGPAPREAYITKRQDGDFVVAWAGDTDQVMGNIKERT